LSQIAAVERPPSGPELEDPATRRRLSAPALEVFFNIARAWRLPTEMQKRLLGSPPSSTFFRWRKGMVAALSLDALDRIGMVVAIYGALQELFGNAPDTLRWLNSPNSDPLFAGQSPLESMAQGRLEDLALVRRYVQGWQEVWP
jgi:uncharacterized protein (DUF2384 family)